MRLISADDHVQEPPDLWTKRLPRQRWGDRVPRLADEGWTMGALQGQVARAGAFMPDRKREPQRWEEVPAAAYLPAARLRAMDRAEIEYSALYPTVAGFAGQALAAIEHPDLELACVQAYNDWLIEEWGGASRRFIPQCIVPLQPDAAAAEIRRAIGLGHRGVVFPAAPHELRAAPHVADAAWEPVWAACEELGTPLCLHAGASPALQNTPPAGLAPAVADALDAVTRPVSSVYVLNMFLLSGILQRHPGLRLVLAESALSWAMLDLEWTDHQFEHDGLAAEGELTPSELFHRQVHLTAWFDRVAPFVDYVGADNILWSTNLPLATSSWPRTRETIDRCFQDVVAADRERILWGNAAALYGIAS